MTEEETGTLIGRTAIGDRAAFRRLYDRTAPKLFAIALRILKDRADAEEALQEIYVKIWQRAGQFSDAQGTPQTWLAAIARNQAIDVMRKRKPVADEIDTAYDLHDEAHSPEQCAVIASEGRRIDTCMQALEPQRAQAVRKAYVEGLSYEELAGEFEVPINTMRTWLRRGLISLRECLER